MNTPTSSPLNPYTPPRADVYDIPQASGEPAARVTRLGAVLLDGLAFFCVLVPAAIARTMELQGAHLQNVAQAGILISGFLGLLWAAATLYLLHRNGQSIGKRLLRIKIVRTDGSRASLARIFFLRGLLSRIPAVIPVIGYLYVLVDACMIFGDSRRCLHDRIAGTRVIKA